MGTLTPQDTAVRSDADRLCIIACAGSGKTTTLGRRIARLLKDQKFKPSEIVAITFTRLAAEHLKQKIRELHADATEVEDMFIGTIHSFCFDILKAEDPDVGESYSVIDENRQALILFRFWNSWNIQALKPDRRKADLIRDLIRTISVMKTDGVSLAAIEALNPQLATIIGKYLGHLKAIRAFDYADLIGGVVARVQNGEFLQRVQARYKCYLVDEYQDVDDAQDRLISILSNAGWLTVVGDDDQSIYRFRGTDVRNIQRFANSLPPQNVVPIDTNFRCRQLILKTAESAVAKLAQRIPKDMKAHRPGGVVIPMIFPSVADEATWIVQRIKKLRDDGCVYSQMAVLLRSVASYGSIYLDALRSEQIPFICRGDGALFDEPEVAFVTECLEFVAKEHLSVGAILDCAHVFHPVGTFSDATRLVVIPDDELPTFLPIPEQSLFQSLNNVRLRYQSGEIRTTPAALYAILSCIDVLQRGWPDVAYYNIGALTEAVVAYDAIYPSGKLGPLCGFIKSFLVGNIDLREAADQNYDAVRVLTIHQAKGLEFSTVFMPMLVQRRFPVEGPSQKTLLPDSLSDPIKFATSIEDERRLCYVAMTRARDALFLSAATDVGLKSNVAPSIFFNESSDFLARSSAKPADVVLGDEAKEPPDRDPLSTSFSGIEYYLSCPYRYMLVWDYKFSFGDNPFFIFGRILHHIVQKCHLMASTGASLTEEEITTLFQSMLPAHVNIPKYSLMRQVTSLSKSIVKYCKVHKDWLAGTISTEQPFTYQLADATIKGRIDLIFKDAQGDSIICDWKTGKPHDYLRKDVQMQIYMLAAKEVLRIPIKRAQLHYIEIDETISFAAEDNYLAKAKAELEMVLVGIKNRQFNATPGEVCSRCECRQFCPYRV